MPYYKIGRFLVFALIIIAPLFIFTQSREGEPSQQVNHSQYCQTISKTSKKTSSHSSKIVTETTNTICHDKGEESKYCPRPDSIAAYPSFYLCSFTTLSPENIIAIFTVIIGIATALLFFATDNLVRGADDTARKQLRAYVHAIFTNKTGTFFIQLGHSLEIPITIENSGQTPAYDVVVNIMAVVHDYPMTSPLPNLIESEGSKTVLHPRAKIYCTISLSDSLTQVQVDDIKIRGTKKIYMFGKVSYRDIYNIPRETTIRLMSMEIKNTGQYAFTYCNEGNDAN